MSRSPSNCQKHILIGVLDEIVICVFCGLMILFPNDTITWWVIVIFAFFQILGLIIIISTIVLKIDLFRSRNYFIYRTSYGKKYTIKYDECDGFKLSEKSVTIYWNKKKIKIDCYAVNIEFLIGFLQKNKVKEIK